MNFRTPVGIQSKKYPKITHADTLMSLGSCFSNHIGGKLQRAKLDCQVNPYGVLYNPKSIAQALHELIRHKKYTSSDLFEYNGLWHSWMHHGSFSAPTPELALNQINKHLSEAQNRLPQLDYLFLTWGSAWVYELLSEERLVSNCHKVPSNLFRRVQLGVDEIVQIYCNLFRDLWVLCPSLKVVLSLSPIRHVRDGMHANQISKSILLLAQDKIQQLYPDRVYYFPSYELVLDELRDYRFYADDMVHPSPLAIDYIWQRFQETFFDSSTQAIIRACEQIQKGLAHRPTDASAPAYASFLQDLVDKMEQLSIKYPKLDFRKEINQCLIQLKK